MEGVGSASTSRGAGKCRPLHPGAPPTTSQARNPLAAVEFGMATCGPSSGPTPPPGWDPRVRYITDSILDPDLESSRVQNLVKQVDNDLVILDRLKEEQATKNPSWKIQKITNVGHPAYGESGLFAQRDLNPGELIVEYKGVITDKSDGLSGKSDYVIELTPELSIDAEGIGNEGRFVNDYRGTPVHDHLLQQTPSFGVKEKHNRKPKPHKQSRAAPSEFDKNRPGPKPNADFKTFIFTDSPDSLHIGIFVKTLSKKEIKLQQTSGKSRKFQGIRQGQEVLVSYGRRYWHKRGLYLDNDFDAWAERYGWEWE